MVDETGAGAGETLRTQMERLKRALESAFASLRDGELEETERRAKAVSALVRAARDVQTLKETTADEEEPDHGEPRTKFLRKLAGYMEPERARELLQRLDQERGATPAPGLADLGS